MSRQKKIKRPRLTEVQYHGIKKMLEDGLSQKEISDISGRHKGTIYRIKESSDFQDYLEKQRFYHRKEKKVASDGSGIDIEITIEDASYISEEAVNVIMKSIQAVFGTHKVYASFKQSPELVMEGE